MQNISKEKLQSLLPQSYPMLMVDQLLHSDEEKTTVCLSISSENIFTDEDSYFSSEGLIENMAQTAALRAGVQAQKNGNTNAGKGYIGRIKNLIIKNLPNTGDQIKTSVFVKKKLKTLPLLKRK